MTKRPFKDLPKGAKVTQVSDIVWKIETEENCIEVLLWSYSEKTWAAHLKKSKFCGLTTVRETPDAAFQALRQAVRELANDLGVG